MAQHKKIEQENRARLAEQEKALTEKFEKEKAEIVAKFESKFEEVAESALKTNFLILSQFLRLAAARRMEEPNTQSDEGLALEGVLLHVYSGDEDAVSTMLKLVKGVSETTRSVSDQVLMTTCKDILCPIFHRACCIGLGWLAWFNVPKHQADHECDECCFCGFRISLTLPDSEVKQLAIAHASASLEGAAQAEPEVEVETKETPVETDPTVANASLTEIQEGSDVALANGHGEEHAATATIPATDVADNAANAAGESQWDAGNDMTMSQEWVDVKAPREPSETETGIEGTPAAPANTQSWADDHPEPADAPASSEANDGFHQVQRNRGNREAGYRGRGGDRGGYRGRGGFRGDGRGRGRGGQRGVPSRPRRGGDEQQ